MNPRPDQPDELDEDGLTSYRVGHLEKQMDDLMLRSEGWHNSLGTSITALSNQIGNFQASLPEYYAPRREANERHQAIEARFDSVEHRFEDRRAVIDQRVLDLTKEVDQRITQLRGDLDQRFKDNVTTNTKRIERIEVAIWGLVVGVLMSLGGLFIELFKPK